MKAARLANYDNSIVIETARRITAGESTVRGKIERLFYYVRDDIKFGFLKDGDLEKASDIIEAGMGQCNNKSTLFLALCKCTGINARIHFSLIKKEIQRGIFKGIAYRLMPQNISHSWIEIEDGGRWVRIDSYINDREFYQAAKKELKEKGWDTGYSVACSSGSSSAELSLDEEKFVQMDAVVEDQGVWEEPMDYYKTDKYKNRPNFIKLAMYRLMLGSINKEVEELRGSCKSGMCGI